MKESVVVAQVQEGSDARVADVATGWGFIFLVGCCITAIALITILFIVFPTRLASFEWELNAAANIFISMPLLALGIGLMCAAAVTNGSLMTRRMMGVVAVLLALVVLVVGLVFGLDVPLAIRAAQNDVTKRATKLLAAQTGLFALTFFVFYLALGIWTWRRSKAMKGVRG